MEYVSQAKILETYVKLTKEGTMQREKFWMTVQK